MGKLFEDWKIKEFVFLGISLIAIIFCFVFSPDKSVLSLITSIFGVTVVFLIAKGFAFAPIIEIVYDLLYCAVSIILGYYGEAIICVLSFVGNALIFCVGINIAFGKKFRVGNMLPALLIPLVYHGVKFLI